jgi:hypothetical protein
MNGTRAPGIYINIVVGTSKITGIAEVVGVQAQLKATRAVENGSVSESIGG